MPLDIFVNILEKTFLLDVDYVIQHWTAKKLLDTDTVVLD